jgi:uncharacterized protein (DUF433 family)
VTTALDGHIEVDADGTARIAGTRLKVIHLVMDQAANGSTADQMQAQFPPLTLAQIYAALTYYHDHKAELDAQIKETARTADLLRSAAANQPTREQLLSRLARPKPGERP